jgi:hypothetical protein
MREYLQDLYVYSQLPPIRGEWFFVDPQNGVSTNDGKSSEKAFANITSAYAACTSGAGDGIVLLSSGTTTAHTTSYLEDGEEIDWTKHAITVIGISSGCRSFGRARIANKATTGEALPYLIDVQGDNNAFINIHLANYGTDAAAVGCLRVTGNRNYFKNVHCVVGIAAGATANERSLELNACQENTFEDCSFGTDTVDRGNNASVDILITGACARNRFIDCETIAHVSTGTAKGAIKINATSGGRPTVFKNCSFLCFATAQAEGVLVGGSNEAILIQNCVVLNYSAWCGSSNLVYVDMPAAAASAAGGIPTTI